MIKAVCQNLDYKVAVASWLLDAADRRVPRADYELALALNHMAARVLAAQSRDLSSSRIESTLQNVAKILPRRKTREGCTCGQIERKEIWLHVINDARFYGGHTAMAARWIENDNLTSRTHCVALLSQTLSIPDILLRAVRKSGGSIFHSNSKDSLLRKAGWLRDLCAEIASYVVLHVDVDDVIAGVAFGVEGGPPVLLVNHAAHIYWTGGSITDLVVNCRGSRAEENWTEIYRGISRCATIPIPLLDSSDSCPLENESISTRNKEAAKEKIGVPANCCLILTVGDGFKYTPLGQLDFIKVAEDILQEVPNAFVVAVGPDENSYWRAASDRVGKRLRALGRRTHSEVATFRQAADLYIEGFPLGSATALLEAGLNGLPVVLAPAECPPPYGTDGISLDEILKRPSSVDEYKHAVVLLTRNSSERNRIGTELSYNLKRHHTGAGWRQYLDSAITRLPREHSIYPIKEPPRTPESLYSYWAEFRSAVDNSLDPLDYSIKYAFVKGIRLKLTTAMLRACKEARGIRIGKTIPVVLLYVLCNLVFPLLPVARAREIYSQISAFCRPGSRTSRFLTSVLPEFLW